MGRRHIGAKDLSKAPAVDSQATVGSADLVGFSIVIESEDVMFGDLVRQWYRLLFWWLPDDQKQRQDERYDESEKNQEPGATPPASTPASQSARESSGEASSPKDDLTAIKGIGPAMDKRLQAMGIKTFRDLAAADAQEVASKLNSRPVTAVRVAEWMAEAKKRG